ncbi:MAG TPA: serine/threonine-protein kinase [Ktedonobacterales bacterium]
MSERRLTDYTTCDVTVERVERGGMGRVYMGPDHRFLQGMWSALKTLHPRLLATERGRRLFLNECLTWVGLWPHPNLLTAHAVTEINSHLFLVLDYAEEGSLRDFLSRAANMTHGQPLPLSFALEAAQHIAAGLLVLHTPDPAYLRPKPIVHRDLKPENILILQGFAQITDFGLARVISGLDTTEGMTEEMTAELEDVSGADNTTDDTAATRSRRYRTQRGVAMGTFPYMPPEQWVDAATVGPPADLYAFGIILGELVMGNHPLLPWERSRYAGEDQWRMIHLQARPPALAAARAQARDVAGAAHMAEPPLPAELETLFQRLLAKHADERPTAAETFAALRRIAAALGEEPYTPPEICPHTPENDYHRWHGWAISYEGFELYDEALACNDRALALAPTKADVLLTRGNILAQLGRLDEALGFYDRALQNYSATDTDHQASVWSSRGNALSLARRFPEAEAAYTQALRLNARSPTTWANQARNEGQWGRACAESGQRAEAERHWRQGLRYIEESIRINPNDPITIALRGALLQLFQQ